MSTVSTEEIAAIPAQEVEQEPKSISSPLESAESDAVSVMAEPTTSRSLFYLTTYTWPAWMAVLFEGGNCFSRGKAGLVSILLATASCAENAHLLRLFLPSCRETLLACAGHKFVLDY